MSFEQRIVACQSLLQVFASSDVTWRLQIWKWKKNLKVWKVVRLPEFCSLLLISVWGKQIEATLANT